MTARVTTEEVRALLAEADVADAGAVGSAQSFGATVVRLAREVLALTAERDALVRAVVAAQQATTHGIAVALAREVERVRGNFDEDTEAWSAIEDMQWAITRAIPIVLPAAKPTATTDYDKWAGALDALLPPDGQVGARAAGDGGGAR